MNQEECSSATRFSKPKSPAANAFLLSGLLLVLVLVAGVRLLPLFMPVLEQQAAILATAEAVERLKQTQGLSTFELPDPGMLHSLAGDPALGARKGELAALLREQRTFMTADGRLHPYLGDYDSYHWLRLARNLLEHGSVCDRVVAGQCRDMLTIAPWGTAMVYGQTPHVSAIAGLHRLITVFRPDYPLSSSAYWVPVLVGLAGVLPAFFLGYRLGGPVGGLTAGLLASLNPSYLTRSFGADNDVWNVVLLLLLQWAVLSALLARSRMAALFSVALAAALSVLWAAEWSGWVYGYLLTLTLLGVYPCLLFLGNGTRHGLGFVLALPAGYFLLTGIGVWIIDPSISPFGLPLDIVKSYFAGDATTSPSVLHWPDLFATVQEAAYPGLDRITESLGGSEVFLLAYLGLLLICLPATTWGRGEPAILAAGVLAINLLLNLDSPTSHLSLTLLGIPLFFALALRFAGHRDPRDVQGTATGLLMVLWCLSTLWLGYSGERFLMLFGMPWAIALGAAVGQVYRWLRETLAERGPGMRRLGGPALVIGLTGLLYLLARPGVISAVHYLPLMNDARAEVLQTIDRTAPADAIVTDLWEYSYWAKYLARRRVHHDGGTLASHVPYWVGRFYGARDDRHSIGLLRMLNCGSEAAPLAEGSRGALHRLKATGMSPAESFRMLESLIRLDRKEGRALLHGQGLSPDQVRDVLAATHCNPPPSLVITGANYLKKPGAWLALALWDPLQEPAGQTLASGSQLFAEWLPCRSTAPHAPNLGCALRVPFLRLDPEPKFFTIEFQRPEAARLHFTEQPFERVARPALVVLAEQGAVRYIEPDGPAVPEVGILVDRRTNRILVARPALLRSTLARLVLVNDYRSPFFERVTAKSPADGEGIKLWRVVRWE